MCQLKQVFKNEEELKCELRGLALHPSGYYMAVGFSHKLHLIF